MQVYVATLTFLQRLQDDDDNAKNQKSSVGDDLLKLKDAAKGLLCDIETLANATGQNKNVRLFKEGFMKKNIKLRNVSYVDYVDQIQTVDRFNTYIKRLEKRLNNFKNISERINKKQLRRMGQRHRGNKKRKINKDIDNLENLLEKPAKGNKRLPKLSRQGRMIIVRPQ
jgi:hypothetical protein